MQCPNCKYAEDGAAAECSRCGLVFTKWRAAMERAQGGQSVPLAQSSGFMAPVKTQSGWGLGVWTALFAATVGVWLLNRSGREDYAAAPSVFSGRVSPAASNPVAKNAWRFEGRVFDLLRGGPIKGAKISFLDFETGHYYEDVTDDEGQYSVDVEIRWKLGYAAEISHPLYQRRYWAGSALTADRPDRLRMGLEAPSTEPDARVYRGSKKKGPVTFDFTLFPQDLTGAERQDAGL